MTEKKSSRSRLANTNSILSIIFRGGSILLQFALIPLTIDYVKPDSYGVWVTLSSIVGWIAMFDIGIGNGLKNKLTESIAKEEYDKGKIYVSTTYFMISVIALVLIVLYLIITPFINWQQVFNSEFIIESELRNIVTVVTVFFILKFVSDIINVVSASFQMVSITSFLLFVSNLGLTGSIWILKKTTQPNLILMAFLLSAIPFLISLFANIFLFAKKFKVVSPSFKWVDLKNSKSIVSLGSQFFILQLVSLIIFQTDNILIAQLFSPADVTSFNIAYKYYSVTTVLFTIFLAPYWTAFTDSYYKGDFDWIRKTIIKLYRIWFLSIVFLVVMLFFADFVISHWIGNEVVVSRSLSISICLYVAISNWSAIFASFLNGVGKIRLQIYLAILVGALNIPLSLFLVRYLKWGTYAMPSSNVICLTLGAIIGFIQYQKLITNNANGIWNK